MRSSDSSSTWCRRNQKLRWLLENEGDLTPSIQDSSEDGSLEAEAQRCKGSTLWELTLAKRHAHPHVAQAAATIAAIPIEGECGDYSLDIRSG